MFGVVSALLVGDAAAGVTYVVVGALEGQASHRAMLLRVG
jgi:hypothetical protein